VTTMKGQAGHFSGFYDVPTNTLFLDLIDVDRATFDTLPVANTDYAVRHHAADAVRRVPEFWTKTVDAAQVNIALHVYTEEPPASPPASAAEGAKQSEAVGDTEGGQP
jgi:hypothetical protein